MLWCCELEYIHQPLIRATLLPFGRRWIAAAVHCVGHKPHHHSHTVRTVRILTIQTSPHTLTVPTSLSAASLSLSDPHYSNITLTLPPSHHPLTPSHPHHPNITSHPHHHPHILTIQALLSNSHHQSHPHLPTSISQHVSSPYSIQQCLQVCFVESLTLKKFGHTQHHMDTTWV